MDSSVLVVNYCKSHLVCFLFEMKQNPEKDRVILEKKNHFDPIKGNEPEKDTDSLVNTLIGGEAWDMMRRMVVSPFPLVLICSGILFCMLLLAAVFSVLRLYCAGYTISTPRSSLTSTVLDSVEWATPSGFFRQRTSYPESIERRKGSNDSTLSEQTIEETKRSKESATSTISNAIEKQQNQEYTRQDSTFSTSCGTQTDLSHIHQGIRSNDLCQIVTIRSSYV